MANHNRLKNVIITGRHLKDLEACTGLNLLDIQSMLGLYPATFANITSAAKIDEPIDRLYAASVRFLTKNYPRYYNNISVPDQFRLRGLPELTRAIKKQPLTVYGISLIPDKVPHLGIILMRKQGAARKFLLGADAKGCALTLPLQKWINLVVGCLDRNCPELIEAVIVEEISAHYENPKDTFTEMLKKAWLPD